MQEVTLFAKKRGFPHFKSTPIDPEFFVIQPTPTPTFASNSQC